ncbi:LPS translocon maturation chaperone LptM [Hoeflea sp.]|uniref:LPS translocon maturation chaperone LptM n=1 Tax=Hoeflea sp. TaxID=1940281 RepID=UPI003A904CBA
MTTGVWIKSICAVALLSAVLTGCGRRGELERPNVTPVPAGSSATAEEMPAPAVRERHFILDGLLE